MSGRLGRFVPRSRRGRGVLFGLVAAFVLVRTVEAVGAAPAWVAAWADDLLCLPLVLTAILACHRLAGRPAGWTLPAVHGLCLVAVYAVLFEVVLPALDRRATADPLDALAYAAGWLVFQVLLNEAGRADGPAVPLTCGLVRSSRS